MSTSPEPKKKKERAPPPPCPPGVATAVLLIRAAVYSVTGSFLYDDGKTPPSCSLLQATYLKDAPLLTGKFSIAFGKRTGDTCCLLPIGPHGDSLLGAIATAVTRLVQQPVSINCYATTLQNVVDTYGASCLDGSHAKIKDKTTPVTVASIVENGVLVAATVPQSIPYASSAALSGITIDFEQSSVSGDPKAKKAEIGLKFSVQLADGGPAELATVETLALPPPPTTSSAITAPEGLLLKAEIDREKEKAAEEERKQKEVEQAAAVAEEEEEQEMVVNVEEVKGKVDYNKLVEQFGSTLIDESLLESFRNVAGTPRLHRWLRRGMFFSHRDLHTFLQAKANGTPVYLYTGRGPSSESMHLGHLIPFLFTQWLQEVLDAPLVIQMTDDEKFIFKGNYEDGKGDNLQHFAGLTVENAKDIIACGFRKDRTFLFSDLDYVGRMYPNIVRIWKAVTTNQISNIFGFDSSASAGKIAFPAVQAAPSFSSSFPVVLETPESRGPASNRLCLIPCAIDQDPYFRMTRDVAHKLVDNSKHALGGKPALLHSKFFPALQGSNGKMSSSNENSAIFLTDSPETIRQKIKSHAFSGGQETQALQRERGADLSVDVAYQWLRFFLEDDDELEKIGRDYSTGTGEYWSTSVVKDRLVDVLQKLVAEHQERRAKVTDEEVREWMKERSIVS